MPPVPHGSMVVADTVIFSGFTPSDRVTVWVFPDSKPASVPLMSFSCTSTSPVAPVLPVTLSLMGAVSVLGGNIPVAITSALFSTKVYEVKAE